MVVEDNLIGFRQRRLRRLNLLDQVYTVAIFLDHGDDAVYMPGHTLEAVNKRSLLTLFHTPPKPLPSGGGYGSVYHAFTNRQEFTISHICHRQPGNHLGHATSAVAKHTLLCRSLPTCRQTTESHMLPLCT